MRSWRDEWKAARLHLRLRGSQLFHGETVTLDVLVEDASGAGSSDRRGLVDVPDARSAGIDAEFAGESGAHAQAALLQRWLDRCDGASVSLKVVADDSAGRRREQSSPHPSVAQPSNRQTLFHQEAKLAAVQCGRRSGTPAHYLLLLRAEFELTVRSEFWGRPLALIAHVTPKDVESGELVGLTPTDDPLSDPVQTGALLSDEWLATCLLPLIREESAPAASLTKRLECPITVVRPLQVQVETRALAARRVAVVVKALNTRSDITLEVLDLQLHLTDSPSGSAARKSEGGPSTPRYVLLDGAKAPFPVSLLAHERYNFLFVLEPVDPPVREPAAVTSADSAAHHAVGASAASILSRHWNAAPSRGPVDPVDERVLGQGPEHALLTLTWKARESAARAITEQHTIVWSPFALSLDSGSTSTRAAPPRADWSHFVVPQALTADAKAVEPSGSASFVTLRADSALHVTLLPPAPPPRVGQVATACIAITNRSRHATFDLTLVIPCQPQQDTAVPDGSPGWISFEASHHLGLVRPGKSVRKSVHLALLSTGAAPDAVVLVDARTRTCFRALLGR